MWINITTGKTLLTHSDIRKDASNASLPATLTDELLNDLGYLPVMLDTPAFDPVTQTATELSPLAIAGIWTQQWVIAQKHATPEEEVAATAAHLATLKDAQWDAIKAERDRRTQTGGYYVAPHWYHSDTFSRTQQLGLILLGANIPDGTVWKTLDNGLIAMTPTLAGQIFGAAANSDIAIHKAAETHKAAMEASADPAAYDFSGGWPVMYEAV